MLRIAGSILITMLACTAQSAPVSGSPDDNKAQPMTPSPPTKPRTTLEQVQQAFPAAHAAVAELKIPGVELFTLTTDRPVPPDGENLPTYVAITGGLGSPILQGRDITRAALKATKDPSLLARVAMAAEQKGGELLTAPQNDQQKKANVGPPVIAGNTLTFWLWTSGMGRMLMLAKLDLTTGALELGGPPVSPDDRLAEALEALAGTSLSMHQHAIATLAAACTGDPKARKALLDTATSHQREETRATAVEASTACGAAAIDTLIKVMEHDASTTVRWKSAKALGDIGDAKARPALEKAATSSDANVKSAATRALGKLK
jgi:hypothetical protein